MAAWTIGRRSSTNSETVQKRATFSGPLWPEGKCIQPIYVIEERRSLCTTQNEGALKMILAGFASARFRIVVCSKDFSAAHTTIQTSGSKSSQDYFQSTFI